MVWYLVKGGGNFYRFYIYFYFCSDLESEDFTRSVQQYFRITDFLRYSCDISLIWLY